MYYNLRDLKKQTKVYYSTSRGPGGQRRDRKKTGVEIHHEPSNIVIRVEKLTSQGQNKKLAFELLQKKLKKLSQRRKKRILTRIPKRAKEKRLRVKKHHSRKKKLRERVAIDKTFDRLYNNDRK